MENNIWSLYVTTNTINSKYYVGVHKECNNQYLGSGAALKRDINKYGKENFKRTVLNLFNNERDAYHAESVFVTQEIVDNARTYNLTTGGRCPPSPKGKKLSIETRRRMSVAKTGVPMKAFTDEHRRKLSEAAKVANTGYLVTCPQCNKTGNVFGMRRWHFNNCNNIKRN